MGQQPLLSKAGYAWEQASMADTKTLEQLQAAIERGDCAAALQLAEQLAGQGPWRGLARLTLSLLIADTLAHEPSQRNLAARQAREAFSRRFGRNLSASEQLLFVDLYLAGGEWQRASELCRQIYSRKVTSTAAAHRLGLCELARALTSSPAHPETVVSRWRQALAYLTIAATDSSYFEEWIGSRLAAYGVSAEEGFEQSRSHVFERLRRMLLLQAEQAQGEGRAELASGLRELAVELEADLVGSAMMATAVSELGTELPSGEIPVPFGMLWYQAARPSGEPCRVLGDLIRQTMFVPAPTGTGETDPTAPTQGIALRQWYSRLWRVRHALRWGHLEAAKADLAKICHRDEQCQANPHPALGRIADGPRCCDPACAEFAVCNPGYAGLSNPAEAMEEDAHRLALRICLLLAERCVSVRPPRFIEAAQHWVAGRALAKVLHETGEYEEDVAGQVLELLESYRERPEQAAELLERAMAAVPGPTIRGRFADRLTDRGIERNNARSYEEGANDLRWALRLNPCSQRTCSNLGVVLQNLALDQRARGRSGAALETVEELCRLAERSMKDESLQDSFAPLQKWAQEAAASWR